MKYFVVSYQGSQDYNKNTSAFYRTFPRFFIEPLFSTFLKCLFLGFSSFWCFHTFHFHTFQLFVCDHDYICLAPILVRRGCA
ncbi:hypothetical protein L208DRAFT_328030 [Tricholoma matsutake]|nr:hypothetical protein L208DRAFT_328030 [Tricholoma matsutake 945]